MPKNKGFTLMELIVVLIIVGVMARIIIPTYITSQMQGEAKAAQNNLITIYTAEKNFYFTNTTTVGVGQPAWYCATSNQNTICGNSLANINANMSLNISDSYFTYVCSDPAGDAGAGTTFNCTATNGGLVLTLTNNSIVLPGGVGCTPGSTALCNPSCADAANPNYCPSVYN